MTMPDFDFKHPTVSTFQNPIDGSVVVQIMLGGHALSFEVNEEDVVEKKFRPHNFRAHSSFSGTWTTMAQFDPTIDRDAELKHLQGLVGSVENLLESIDKGEPDELV